MKIKCRGYEGTLLELKGNEIIHEYGSLNYGTTMRYEIGKYTVEIRLEDGAKIELENVRDQEIEVLDI